MVKFCTYNTRGLRDTYKRKELFTLLKHKKLDVVLLQETHSLNSDMKIWRSQWGGDILYSNASNNSKGVLILLHRGLQYECKNEIIDDNGRYIILEIQIEDTILVLCNLYAPNQDTPDFFMELVKHIEDLDNKCVIMGGDFNFAIDPFIDRKFSHYNNDKSRDFVVEFMELLEMTDAWRALHPQKRQYSCCRPNTHEQASNKFSRIDMFLVSNSLMSGVRSAIMQTGYRSDHSFVIVDIQLMEVQRGPGYWKFNNSLLRDRNFVHAANVIIEEALQDQDYAPDLR